MAKWYLLLLTPTQPHAKFMLLLLSNAFTDPTPLLVIEPPARASKAPAIELLASTPICPAISRPYITIVTVA
ncbi:hypothetical protein GOP47_0011716 [Adiantum capillus-veneris]|uniref:Uncharacterized protein n=1 Tax=Adiantum capillus-veneris TaxID=13818 RepID=A0A9D4ZFN3_ADICA|nr:hypothetical protein GOP47_0011716 [Adiantum capillus-veneris]